jgi:hypothetical protein
MMFKRLLLLPALIRRPSLVVAVSANPNPITEIQSDGTSITIRANGDELDPYVTTEDGYTIVNEGGIYYYAKRNGQGNLVTTGRRADKDNKPPGLKPKLRPTKEAREKECKEKQLLCARPDEDVTELTLGEIPMRRLGQPQRGLTENRHLVGTTGTLKNLVVLIKFSDHTARTLPSRADIDILMNHVGPHALAPTGSVRDMFTQSSYGQLTIESTVVDWVTVNQTEACKSNMVLHLQNKFIQPNSYMLFTFCFLQTQITPMVTLDGPH